ncbi:MAG: hypothetical protein WD851_15840 [Pirellulales bacterium]
MAIRFVPNSAIGALIAIVVLLAVFSRSQGIQRIPMESFTIWDAIIGTVQWTANQTR